MPYERDVEAPRRWWLGWLQLLFAWVLCMLLCANIALALAEGLPAVKGEATVDPKAGCTARGHRCSGALKTSGRPMLQKHARTGAEVQNKRIFAL